ncbi:MAG: hypothetical protein ACKVS9_04650 [Phycisphaerae bacterium]
MHRAIVMLLSLLGLVALLAVFGLPLVAILAELPNADPALATLGPRRLILLAKGLGIALAAAAAAQLVGGLLAIGLAATRSHRLRTLSGWLCLVVFLTPPYVYAYAWSWMLVPAGVISSQTFQSPALAASATMGRAILCLTAWLAPVAAFVLAAGWRRHGESALAMQQLDRGRIAATVGAIRMALGPWITLSMLVTFALATTEFSVCHLCLVQTWNTEMLAEAQLIAEPGRVILLAWPLMLVLALIAAVLCQFRARIGELLDDSVELRRDAADASLYARHARGWMSVVCVLVAGVFVLSPMLILATSLRDWTALLSTWRAYPNDWPLGLLGMAISMALALVMALAIDALRTLGGWLRQVTYVATALLIAGMAAPPTLIGDVIAAAYQNMNWVRDHMLIVGIVGAARFTAIPVLLLWLQSREGRDLAGQAAVDRASPFEFYLRVRLPLIWRSLVGGLLIAGFLSLGEVSASQMVAPPGSRSIAITLLNAIHFGRDDQVIAMCLYIFAAAAIVAGLQMRRGFATDFTDEHR